MMLSFPIARSLAEAALRGEAIYQIPEIEMQPELSLRADMLSEDRDWGHVNLGLAELHDAGFTGKGVTVCILDTGADFDHPDLKPNFLASGHKNFTSDSSINDGHGHGSHCSGIAVASNANDAGLTGAAPEASLLIMKVLSDRGSGASSWIAGGIVAATPLADIFSLSLGGPQPDNLTRSAIQAAVAAGKWVVCAAGNDGGPGSSYPGHYPESIAVCATDSQNRRASFSTTNAENDISAPGVSILSTLPGGRYGTMSGTSQAAPYVAGCLALLRAAIKKAGARMPTQAEVLAAFAETSKDLGTPGRDVQTGWGLIMTKALIAKFVAVPPPPPPPSPKGWSGVITSPYIDGVLQRPIVTDR